MFHLRTVFCTYIILYRKLYVKCYKQLFTNLHKKSGSGKFPKPDFNYCYIKTYLFTLPFTTL